MSKSNRKNKKQPRNGYYFLMLDFKKQNEELGHYYTMLECSELVQEQWTSMSQVEKDYYNKMASDYKQQVEIQKFNSKGRPFIDVDREIMEKEHEKRVMDQIIMQTVKSLEGEALQTKIFHLIHINYFCVTETGQYIPAEIALVEFNLLEGVRNTMHRFLQPGELPKGYRYNATEHCNATHRTPLDLKKGDITLPGETSLHNLLKDIKAFIKPDGGTGELPPLYTMQDNLNMNTSESAVRSVLADLCENSCEDPSIFKIFTLPKLFLELRNQAAGEIIFQNQGFAEGELEKDVFNYTKGIACDFHEEEDVVQYCSLSMVRRWVFLICDHCCKDLNIHMNLGTHCPKTADIDQNYKMRLANLQGKGSSVCDTDSVSTTTTKSYHRGKAAANPAPPLREPRQKSVLSMASSVRDSDTCSVSSASTAASTPWGAVGGIAFSDVVSEGSVSAGRGRGMVGTNLPKPVTPSSANWSRVASTEHTPPPVVDDDNFPSIGQSARSSNFWAPGRGRGQRGGRLPLATKFNNLSLD